MPAVIIERPAVSLDDGTYQWRSMWLPGNNDQFFHFLRRDFEVTQVTDGGAGTINVQVSGFANPIVGEEVYIGAPPYAGAFAVNSVTAVGPNTIINVDATFQGVATGYLNDHTTRRYYYLSIEVFATSHKLKQLFSVGTMRSEPAPDGSLRVNVRGFIKKYLQLINESQYTDQLFFDPAVTSSFHIAYTQVWLGSTNTAIVDPFTFIVTNSVKQIRETYGYNLAEYVSVTDDVASAYKAKLICDFEEPKYWPGYPFDLAWLFPKEFSPISLTLEQERLDSNGNIIGIVNDQLYTPVAEGLLLDNESRIILRDSYSAGTKCLDVFIQANEIAGDEYVESDYVDADYVESTASSPLTPFEVTLRKRVCLDENCYDNPVYLAWKGTHGGWNYYLFAFDQGDTLETDIEGDFTVDIDDPENAEGKTEVIQKSSAPMLTLGAEGIENKYKSGLKTLFESPKVQMLLNQDDWTTDGPKWETVKVLKHSFSSQTRNSRFRLELTLGRPFRNTIYQ